MRGNVEARGLVCGTTSTISASNRGILHLKSSGSCESVVHKNLIAACALDASADVRTDRTSAAQSRERHRTTAALCEPTNARRLAPSVLRDLMPASVLKAPRLGMHSVLMPPDRTAVMEVLRLFSLRLSVSYLPSNFDAGHDTNRWRLHCRRPPVSRGRTTRGNVDGFFNATRASVDPPAMGLGCLEAPVRFHTVT